MVLNLTDDSRLLCSLRLTQSVRFTTHKKIREIREICVSPRKANPTQSVRFTTHKKIRGICEICVSTRKAKPTQSVRFTTHKKIREICGICVSPNLCEAKKSKGRSVCEACYFSSRRATA